VPVLVPVQAQNRVEARSRIDRFMVQWVPWRSEQV
jgi:hypothetical protein